MSPDAQVIVGAILSFLLAAIVAVVALIGKVRERLARIEQWIDDRSRRRTK